MKRSSSIIIGLASVALALLAPAALAGNYEQAVMSLQPYYYWHLDEADGATQAAEVVGVSGDTLLAYRYNAGHKVDTAGIYGRAAYMSTSPGLGSEVLDSQTAGGGYQGNLATFDPATQVSSPAHGVGDIPGSLSASTGYTVQFWLKPTSHAGNTWSSSAGATYSFSYVMADSTESYFSLAANQIADGGVHRLQFTDDIVSGQWNFLTMTVVRTASGTVDLAFYTNGQLKGSGSFSGLPSDFGAWGTLFMGAPLADSGAIDEIAIFDYALSQQQILNELDAIPEPGMLSLLALGGAFLVWRRRQVARRA